ncbi:MAG: hypothetical protein AAGJ96_00125 [Pseudomonadota bacterium]
MKFAPPLALALVGFLAACGGDDDGLLNPNDIEDDTDVDEAFFSSDFEATGPKIFTRRSDGVAEYFLYAKQDNREMAYEARVDLVLSGSAGFSEGRVRGGDLIPIDIDDVRESCGNTCETRGIVGIALTEEEYELGQEEGLRVTFEGNKTVSVMIPKEYFIGFERAVDDAK